MKNLIKFIPVALGVLTLASCSSDDFLGGIFNSQDQLTLTATVQEDGETRAAKDASGSNFTWNTGDVLRVYDSKLQKYDTFKKEAANNFFTLGTSSSNFETVDYAYALFAEPSCVSYGGWANGKNVALLKIGGEVAAYSEGKAADNATIIYKAAIPMWGTVTPSAGSVDEVEAKDAKAFDTKLNWLTGQAKMVFKNGEGGAVKAARARSLRFATSSDIGATGVTNLAGAAITAACVATPAEQAAIIAALKDDADISTLTATIAGAAATAVENALIADVSKPLSGWFEATLETGGKLQQITDETNLAAVNTDYSNEVTVIVAAGAMKDYTNVVYLPLIPATYELLVFEYTTDNTNWKVVRALDNKEVTTSTNIGKMTKDFALDYYVEATNTNQLNNALEAYNSTKGSAVVNINVLKADKSGASDKEVMIYDDADLCSIEIPDLNYAMTINIGNATKGMDNSNRKLIIKDAGTVTDATLPVTINFIGAFAAGGKDIEIQTVRPITLTGTVTNAGKIEKVAAATGAFTMGTTEANFITTQDVTVKAGAINVQTNDGTSITTLKQDGTGTINIQGGSVGTLTVKKNTALTLNMYNDAKIATTINEAAAFDANTTWTIATYDNAEIAAIATTAAKTTTNITANITSKTTAAATTAVANIYTGAQLLKVASYATAGAVTLKANVVIANGINWNPLSLNANTTKFDGGSKSISGLNAPLFNTLSKPVQNLTLNNVNIDVNSYVPAGNTLYNIGALAKIVDSSTAYDANDLGNKPGLTFENIVVNAVNIGASYSSNGLAEDVYNVGGLFGKVTGNTADTKIFIKDCGVNVTGAIQGFYNLGGYVGLVQGNATASKALGVEFSKSADNKNVSNIAGFKKTFWSSSAVVKVAEKQVCGTVGFFIGSIIDGNATAGTTTVTLGNGSKSTKANFFSNSLVLSNTAVTDAYNDGALEFGRNTNTGVRTGKAFLGMQSVAFMNATTPTTVDVANAIGQLVGYCPVTTNVAIDKIWNAASLTHTGSTAITVNNTLINKYAE